MEQNINLLNNLPKFEESPLTAKLQFYVLLGFTFFLLIIYVVNFLSTSNYRIELAALTKEKNSLLTELTLLSKSESSPTQSLRYENAMIADVVAAQIAQNANISGFSGQLETLAKKNPDGIWLENISISENNNVALGGQTITEGLLPSYVRSLSGNSVFSDKPFSNLTIQKDLKTKVIKFSLSNFF
jgi:Tfp pilus assembly protein PilN